MPQAAGKHQPAGADFVKRQREKIAEAARSKQTHRKLYGKAHYQSFRRSFLDEHPLCHDCTEKGETPARRSKEVHHIRKLAEHPEDLVDADHCLALCQYHHAIRTGKGE